MLLDVMRRHAPRVRQIAGLLTQNGEASELQLMH